MDNKKIGKFIASLRKEKEITQEQLAFEIMTTRENISKYERGVTTPPPESLLLLGKYFGVSVNEILMGERKTEENQEQVENMSVEVMKAGERKVKKILKRFITLVSLMVVAFLVYYFINTYNTIRVYKIDGYSENFDILEGLAIFSKGKSYLRIGTIEPIGDFKYDTFEVFYKDKDDEEKLVLVSDDTNYTLLSSYEYNEVFSYKNLNEIENNTYIRIKYQDKEEVIKLNFQRDMVNHFLLPDAHTDIIDDSKFEKNATDVAQKLQNYAKKNWKYDKENYEYFYSENNNRIKYEVSYHVDENLLYITEYKNDIICIVEVNLLKNLLYYSEKKDETLKEIYKYNYNTNECLSENCDDNTTNYYLENYYYKYIK